MVPAPFGYVIQFGSYLLVCFGVGYEAPGLAMGPDKQRKLSLVLQRLYMMGAPKAG